MRKYAPNIIAGIFCGLFSLQLLQFFFSIYKIFLKNNYKYDFILCKQTIIL